MKPPLPTDETPTTPDTIPKEQYYRLAADFENYRKAMDQQLIEMNKYGSQKTVLHVIEVMDHMDHAIAHASDAVREQSEWFKGLVTIGEQFHEALKRMGVVRIETSGKTFDPVNMEAMATVPGGESHAVKEEVRPGYIMHDRVIRPARVIIYQ
jgi:molecular chaperone GrpE